MSWKRKRTRCVFQWLLVACLVLSVSFVYNNSATNQETVIQKGIILETEAEPSKSSSVGNSNKNTIDISISKDVPGENNSLIRGSRSLERLKAALLPSLLRLSDTSKQIKEKLSSVDVWNISQTTRAVPKVRHTELTGTAKHRLKYPQITTLELTMQRKTFDSFLLPYYYDYSSNDCKTVSTNSKGTDGLIKHMYNSTCTGDLRRAMIPMPLKHRVENVLKTLMPGQGLPKLGDVVVSNVIIVPHGVIDITGDVHSNNMTIVPTRCRSTYAFDDDWSEQLSEIRCYDEIFTIHQYWRQQFYHSTLESIPRLIVFLEFLRANPKIKIHMGEDNVFLELLGISMERVITGRVRGKVVYMPTGSACGNPDVFTTQMMSLYLKQVTIRQHYDADTIVLIQRLEHPERGRFFGHHEAIWRMVQREAALRGLRAELFSDNPLPNLNDTVELFQRAKVVISPHGAGAANMLFSKPGTVLLEGLNPTKLGYPNTCFIALCQALGLRYYGVFYRKGVTDYTSEDILKPLSTILDIV